MQHCFQQIICRQIFGKPPDYLNYEDFLLPIAYLSAFASRTNNMEETEKHLTAYLNKLLSIEADKKVRLQESDLERLALELGVSWAEVREIRDLHLQKADAFLQNGLYEDAIAQYRECLVLHPHWQPALLGLAKACYGAWLAQPTADKRQVAIIAVRKAIDCYPAEPEPYGLLKNLQTLPPQSKHPQHRHTIVLFFAVGLLFAAIAAALVITFAKRPAETISQLPSERDMVSHSSADEHTEPPQPQPVSPSQPSVRQPTREQSPARPPTAPQRIEISYDEQSDHHLRFLADNSELNIYPSSYAYRLTGHFQVQNAEIAKLKIRVEGLDESGKIIFTEYKDVFGMLTVPAFRPNDLIPFDFLLYKEDPTAIPLHRIRLSVQDIQTDDASAYYAPAQPVALIWNFSKSANINLEAAFRDSRLVPYALDKKSTIHHYTLEFKNTGNQHLSQLKFVIQYLDKEQKILQLHERYAVVPSGPRLKRGYTRIVHGVQVIENVLSEKIDKVVIQITDAR